MALPATDSFVTGTDQSLESYSSNWEDPDASFTLVAIDDNVYVFNFPGLAWWTADSFDDNQYAEAVIDPIDGTDEVGVCVRASGTTPSTMYGYCAYINSTTCYLIRLDGSGNSTPLDDGSGTFTDADVVRITAEGTTIKAYVNDVEKCSATDSTYSSGAAGLSGYGGTGNPRIDSWEGGNLAPPDIELVVPDATHAHTSDNLTLLRGWTLVVADAAHAHTADNLVLTQGWILEVEDALHAHTVDNVDLQPGWTLAIADALHAHSADNITLEWLPAYVVSDDVTIRFVASTDIGFRITASEDVNISFSVSGNVEL